MTINQSVPKRYCPRCSLQGLSSLLHLFQLNDEEALWMCKNVDCTFLPSSDWGSLIVNRNITDIPKLSNKRDSNLLSSSRSVCSIPGYRFKSDDSGFHSRSTTPGSKPRGQADLLSAITGATPYLRHNSSLESPSPPVSECEETGHKTLVPIAPFLSGSAQIFSSFETKKIEDQRLERQKELLKQTNVSKITKAPLLSRLSEIPFKQDSQLYLTRSKRRRNSLESDSLSSSSGYSPTRPLSPVNPCEPKDGKLRKIVVSPGTLSEIVTGKVTVHVSKQSDSIAEKRGSLCNAYSSPSLSSEDKFDSFDFDDSLPADVTSFEDLRAHISLNIHHPIEVTPVFSLDSLDCISNYQTSNSNHIEAINAAVSNNQASYIIKPLERDQNENVSLD